MAGLAPAISLIEASTCADTHDIAREIVRDATAAHNSFFGRIDYLTG